MSRTNKGSKGSGYEYSRRPYDGSPPNSEVKRKTNRAERRRSRQAERQISGYSKSLGESKP